MAIFDTIVQILISILVILTIIGVLLGIVMLIVMFLEKDPIKRKKLRAVVIYSIFGPIVSLFVLLSVWGLIRILTHTVTG
ncbi:MAG: hypothetical protein WCG07_01340 [Candidatus Taylorbacteria bacterium]